LLNIYYYIRKDYMEKLFNLFCIFTSFIFISNEGLSILENTAVFILIPEQLKKLLSVKKYQR